MKHKEIQERLDKELLRMGQPLGRKSLRSLILIIGPWWINSPQTFSAKSKAIDNDSMRTKRAMGVLRVSGVMKMTREARIMMVRLEALIMLVGPDWDVSCRRRSRKGLEQFYSVDGADLLMLKKHLLKLKHSIINAAFEEMGERWGRRKSFSQN